MSFGFGFGFTKITAAIRAAFSPSSLFAANEPGVWYDPSDFSTMFQDAAGTAPVTTVEQPVGLMLDKSKGLVLGPELVVNGEFDTDLSGWGTSGSVVSSVNNGVATITATTTSGITQTILNVGAPYVEVITTIRRSAGSDVSNLIVYGSAGFSNNVRQISISNSSFSVIRFICPNPTGAITLYFQQRNTTIEIDNISVRELPGNHAYQTTSTSRPVLSARYNLLTKTEQFDDAVWDKANITVTANSTNAPDGTATAEQLIEASTTSSHYLASIGAKMGTYVVSGNVYTYSIFVKKGTFATAPSWIQIAFTSSQFPSGYANFNLDTGTYGTTLNVATSTPVNVGNGWWRIGITATATSNATSNAVNVFFTNNNDSLGRLPSYAGSITSDIYIWGADLRVANDGANLPPYQRVNTATDYDADPAKFPHYLRFDGVDDWLVTPTITPGIDKVQVFAGVRKLSNADSVVSEFSANTNTNAGSFYFASQPSGKFASSSRGSALASFSQEASVSGYFAPATVVISALHDIIGDLSSIRANGIAGTNGTADKGTGNYLAYPLYIGRRGGTTLPFNGHLYGLIVRFGSNLPAATIENTEKYINTKTRAY